MGKGSHINHEVKKRSGAAQKNRFRHGFTGTCLSAAYRESGPHSVLGGPEDGGEGAESVA